MQLHPSSTLPRLAGAIPRRRTTVYVLYDERSRFQEVYGRLQEQERTRRGIAQEVHLQHDERCAVGNSHVWFRQA